MTLFSRMWLSQNAKCERSNPHIDEVKKFQFFFERCTICVFFVFVDGCICVFCVLIEDEKEEEEVFKILIYLFAYLLAYLPTYLPTCLPVGK